MENEKNNTQSEEMPSGVETVQENVQGVAQDPAQPDANGEQPADQGKPDIDIDALIAEAELRGYNRGINEQMSRALHEPNVFEDLSRKPPVDSTQQTAPDDTLTSRFLTEIRPNIWDNL